MIPLFQFSTVNETIREAKNWKHQTVMDGSSI